MIDVINLQRKVKLDIVPIRAFAAALSADVAESKGGAFSVAFISDKRMRQLNQTFRGKDTTTDVLSFPMSEPPALAGGQSVDDDPANWPSAHAEGSDWPANNLGDIVISAEQAERQAAENGLSLDTEIKQLILHGLLHLCGYDHEIDDGEMNARELELRKRLGI
ncbi:MAG: rRNA maturation RNase YbeY [Chloracidobacterium sp.]|nr:rRNA maturation RNase YbeY [Chloracidobacterium sp.]MCC6824953.1 rRNA maturation RNase YbeY [Acidobacteriota bacterium]MCO5333232.1 rRNA maturation RNase YbeY [Pyrinomonadaceae bacterium]